MDYDRAQIRVRESRILKNFREGRVSSCAAINAGNARSVEVLGLSGFDCVWIDAEHTANDWQEIEMMIMASKMTDMDSFVRISKGPYNNYIKPFELDATGIMVPHVMSAEEARQIVKMTRFPPIGRRAMDSGNADGAYAMMPFEQYVHNANHNKFIVLQIEDYEAMDDIDEICATEGIDSIFFGSNDFSNSLGCPGDFNNPTLLAAQKRTFDCARKHGKAVFINPPTIQAGLDAGADIMGLAADVTILGPAFRQILCDLDKACKEYGR